MKWIIGKLLGIAVLGLAWALAIAASYPEPTTPAVSAGPALSEEAPPSSRRVAPVGRVERRPAPRAHPAPAPARVVQDELGDGFGDEQDEAIDDLVLGRADGSEHERIDGDGEGDWMERTLSASQRISAAARAGQRRSSTDIGGD